MYVEYFVIARLLAGGLDVCFQTARRVYARPARYHSFTNTRAGRTLAVRVALRIFAFLFQTQSRRVLNDTERRCTLRCLQ